MRNLIDKITKYTLVLVFVLTGQLLKANNYYKTITHYTIKDGLPHNRVIGIHQAEDGFLWLGTQRGVSRYNGKVFSNYYARENDPNSISYDDVSSILSIEDKLYMATYGTGIDSYNPRKNKFSNLCESHSDSIVGDHLYSARLVAQDNYLWASNTHGILKYDVSSDQFKKYRIGGSFFGEIIKDKKGEIWCAGKSIYKYIKSSDTFEKATVLDKKVYTLKNIDSKNVILTANHKYVITDAGLIAIESELPSSIGCALIKNGFIWVGTEKDLKIYDLNFKLVHEANLNAVISSNRTVFCNHIVVGRDNNLWLGTSLGLFKISLNENDINTFNHVLSDKDKSHFVPSFKLLREGRLILSTNSYEYLLIDEKKQSVQKIPLQIKKTINSTSTLFIDYKTFIETDGVNYLWITFDNKLFTYDLNTLRLLHQTNFSTAINHIAYNKVTNELVISSEGLFATKTDQKTTSITDTLASFSVYKENLPTSFNKVTLFIDRGGDVWVGSHSSGVFKYDKKKKKLINIYGQNSKVSSTKFTLSIIESKNGDVWIGTRKGLVRYTPKNTNIKYYFKEDGLESEWINALEEDPNGNIWMISEWGVSKLDVETDKIYNVIKKGDLITNDIHLSMNYNPTNESFYFNSMKGLFSFNEEQVERLSHKDFPFHFTDVLLDGRSIKTISKNIKTDFRYVKEVIIPSDYKRCFFSFENVCFDNDATIEYTYMLDGYDDKWNSSTELKYQARYSDLPSGRYELLVKYAINGGENYEIQRLRVRVLPNLLLSPIFLIIYAVILLAILSIVFIISNRWYVRGIVEKKRMLNRENEIKLRDIQSKLFRDVMRKIEIPFNIIKTPLQQTIDSIPVQKREYKLELEQNLHKMSSLIQKITDEEAPIDSSLFSLNLEENDIVHFTHTIHKSFLRLARANKIRYKFNKYESEVYMKFDKEIIDSFLSGILSLLFKHTHHHEYLELAISKEKELICFELRHSGKGLPFDLKKRFYSHGTDADVNTASFSIMLIKELVKAHDGKITLFEDREGLDVFKILIPIAYDSK
ncbi:MAG: two-component regulator propeller domain-containing protein [Cyclobacteriaceae bacterium]